MNLPLVAQDRTSLMAATTIQQIDDKSYTLTTRGCRMLLERNRDGWRMKTVSAATRVWSMGGESWKDFGSLEEVERSYKSWRGIAALVGSSAQAPLAAARQ